MKTFFVVLLSGISLLLGIILFAIQYDYLIIRFPQPIARSCQQQKQHKKKILFHYWGNHRWHQESEELFWSEHLVENIQRLLNRWLQLMEDHDLLIKQVAVSVAQAPNEQMIYCSFDRYPFFKEWSIYQKWMFLEGLLKTVREATPSVTAIIFLLRHQPLVDTHLNFSHAWPIEGFTATALQ